jgi:formylglycine-generating enzyme required for sulfatase activity
VRFPQIIGVAGLMLLCAIAAVHAEKRVAVVIGNARYANLAANEQLQKAVNDARAVGGALRRIGFDVIDGENLGRYAILARIDAAAQRLAAGDTVFFFFSGHGVAVDGFNYILPADVPALGSGQIVSLTGAAIKEEDITTALLRAGARVTVVVLDACRNNPFASAGTKGVGGEKGLAPHEPPSGVFTFYAASRGESALDRLYEGDANPNSVFTRVLLPALARPDLDLPMLAREVREEVTRLARTVNHAQRPAYYDETSGDRIYLAGVGVAPSVAPPVDPCSGLVTASFPSWCAAPLTAEQERALKPKDTFRECDNCPEMVVVPSGSFTMGEGGKYRQIDEGPQHVETISRPFAIGKFHVTVDQFAAFVREVQYEGSSKCLIHGKGVVGSWQNPGFAQDGSHPVVCVNWDDTNAYVDWLAKKTGKPYRLLSEAEWEYAARGQTSPGTYPRLGPDAGVGKLVPKPGAAAVPLKNHGRVGSSIDDLPPGWYPSVGYESPAGTFPAGHYAPNAFGLYDMAGNAWQWTASCRYYYRRTPPADGSALTTSCGRSRVVRGGAWENKPEYLHASDLVSGTYNSIGFRVARTLNP